MSALSTAALIYKILDIIHDYILCPIFGDKQTKSD